ncbi:MAG: hypothetical protein ACRDG5_12300 [Anaerolineales bacterium]
MLRPRPGCLTLLTLTLASAACGLAPPETLASPVAGPTSIGRSPSPTAGPWPMGGPSPTTPAPTPDLAHRPLYWFAPLPPMPTGAGRPFTGSDDFMALFEPDAPWAEAAARIQVFKLYGEWVAYHASDAQLRQAVEDIRRRGLALAVEAGPLDPPPECGQGIEGFAGTDEGRLIARRILGAGGRIDLIALDEPYFFAHFYDGPNACRWDAEHVAGEVGEFIDVMRESFPELQVGDTEPLALVSSQGQALASGAPGYTAWLQTFRQVNGYDLAFLHMDIDWSRPTWPREVKTIEEFGRAFGVPVGLIYTGNFQDADDEAWLSIAGSGSCATRRRRAARVIGQMAVRTTSCSNRGTTSPIRRCPTQSRTPSPVSSGPTSRIVPRWASGPRGPAPTWPTARRPGCRTCSRA